MARGGSPAAWQRISPTLVTLAIVTLAMGFLYWARPVLIPTAVAFLITFMLGPVVVFLQKRGIPRVPAVLSVTAAGAVLLGLLGWLFVTQTMQLANQLPSYQATVVKKIDDLRATGNNSLLRKVKQFVEKLSEEATKEDQPPRLPDGRKPLPVLVVSNESWIGPLILALKPLLEPIASAGVVFVLVIYNLIEREDLRDRFMRLIGRGHMSLTTMALDDAGHRISRYLLAQFVLNASFGLVIGIGLAVIGVPHSGLWGILAALLRYIPFLGPWMAALFPLTVCVLATEGWGQPLMVVALFIVVELISNMVIEPLLYGQTMGVATSSLLIAIAFWTWLWGAMGLILAAPLTVCLMILGRYVPALKFFDILLGDEPPLSDDLRFYQRLLAHNQDEASRIVREELDTSTLMQVYDDIMIPALTFARQDFDTGRLSAADAELIYEASSEIAEELEPVPASETEKPESPAEPELEKSESGPRIPILVCAARDTADEVALAMFMRLLDSHICDAHVASTDRLASEIVSQVDELRPAVVCIAALPPGGLAHTRLLCKRLKQRYPMLKIMIGRWGLRTDVADNRKELSDAGADMIGTSLKESLTQLTQLSQFLRPSERCQASLDNVA